MSSKFCVTPNGTLAFPTFFAPRATQEGNEPRYSGVLIFDAKAQASKLYQELQDAVLEAAQEKFGKKMPANLRMPFRKGEEKPDYQGFDPGTVFIQAWSKNKPGLIDAAKQEIFDKDEIWAGQLARFYVRPFGYENSGNKGVSMLLEHVQIVKQDRPRIDGRKAATEVFGDVELEDDDEMV